MIDNIKWLGHASFRIEHNVIIYIDPWKLSSGPAADLILITHEHFDHFSPNDIEKVRTDDTIIVGPKTCAGTIQPMRTVKQLDVISAAGLRVEATPAYNINKPFHPRSDDRVGYLIEIDNQNIYHAGDTDHIPEMKNIKCDIALLPVSGKYVMTPEEAARAVDDLRCRYAIPMHYGDIVGSEENARRFKELADCEVRILEKS
ncbi:MBL fold metallo-hydrolase [bacterium]|nr:MBL fold metallo-hydrolase [candidate division CSSED10-310 bacterium]